MSTIAEGKVIEHRYYVWEIYFTWFGFIYLEYTLGDIKKKSTKRQKYCL